MKTTIPAYALKTVVAHAMKGVPAKPTVPILSSVRLSASKDGLSADAFDYYLYARAFSEEADTEVEGAALVHGVTLSNICDALPHAPVTLETADEELVLTAGRARLALRLMSEREAPDRPQTAQTSALKEPELWKAGVRAAAVAVDRNSKGTGLPILNSVLVEPTETGIRLISTNRTLAALVEMSLDGAPPESPAILSPSFLGAVPSAEGYGFDGRLATVGSSNACVTAPTLDATFPPAAARLFADSYPESAVVDVAELRGAIARAAALQQEGAVVTIEFTDDELAISGRGDDSAGHETLDGTLDGQPFTLSANPEYVLGILANLASDELRIAWHPSRGNVSLWTGVEDGGPRFVLGHMRRR